MDPITVTAVTTADLAHARACFTQPEHIVGWNFAADTWECPEATTTLQPGGAFSYRMAARDGSVAFDLSGTWEVVEPARLVQILADGRRVETTFEAEGEGTRITQTFDPEGVHPRAFQQAGWQAILHRFADYASDRPPITLVQLEARPLVGVRRSLPVTELGAFFGEALPKVMGWLGAQGVAPASMPMAVWWAMDMERGVADCQAGCFVAEPLEGEGDITPAQTPSGEALTVTHTGPYDSVGRSWMAIFARAAELGRAPGPGFEIYLDDPGDTPADQLRTQIHLPLA